MPISRGQLLQRRPSILLSWGGHGGTVAAGPRILAVGESWLSFAGSSSEGEAAGVLG